MEGASRGEIWGRVSVCLLLRSIGRIPKALTRSLLRTIASAAPLQLSNPLYLVSIDALQVRFFFTQLHISVRTVTS